MKVVCSPASAEKSSCVIIILPISLDLLYHNHLGRQQAPVQRRLHLVAVLFCEVIAQLGRRSAVL